jgi:hypothetical protein
MRHIRYILIDEMIFLGPRLFIQIDCQLREAFPDKKTSPSGGRSIILVGDLGQLPPVKDNPLYVGNTTDPGGYWWPPTYSTWTHTIVSFIFSISLSVAQFTIFSSSSGPELPELF